MTPAIRHKANNIVSSLHQWMTIIGFPVLIYLVGDMYKDFKEIRTTSIKHESRIQEVEKVVDKHDDLIMDLLFVSNRKKAKFEQTTEQPQ